MKRQKKRFIFKHQRQRDLTNYLTNKNYIYLNF